MSQRCGIQCLLLIVLCAAQRVLSSEEEVCVEQGRLAGALVTSVLGHPYYSFKGVPYARPPTGDLRFKAPEPPLLWTGVRNATEHGSMCPQVNFILSPDKVVGDEDCLFLNVYSPELSPDTPLPVMFFLHGGGFSIGSANDYDYGPDFLVNKSVVLVTINYRLGPFGFLTLDTKHVPGNAGLKDQIMALKWVQKNIAAFGGDPEQVTVFGQSAGGASIAYHMSSAMAKGLFKRAILESGVPSLDCLIPYKPVERAFILGKLLNFKTNDPNKLYDFLSKVPFEQLLNKSCTVLPSEEITDLLFKMNFFTPVVEKDFGQERLVTEDNFLFLDEGRVYDMDIMFGYNNHESMFAIPFYVGQNYFQIFDRYPQALVPDKILISATPDTILDISSKIISHYFGNKSVTQENIEELVNYADAAYLVYDVHRYFRRHPARAPIYFYRYSAQSSRNNNGRAGAPYGLRGAAHGDELSSLFDPKSDNATLVRDSNEYKIIELVTTVFTNFAKYGNPTPDASLGVTWPRFNRDDVQYVEITDTLTVGAKPNEDDVLFWRDILESVGIKF